MICKTSETCKDILEIPLSVNKSYVCFGNSEEHYNNDLSISYVKRIACEFSLDV